jgi:hypothetical protein
MLSIHEIGGWNPVKVLKIGGRDAKAGPEFVEITDDIRRSARRISQLRTQKEYYDDDTGLNPMQTLTDRNIEEEKNNLLGLFYEELNAKVFRPDVRRVDLIDDFEELDGFVHAFVELLHPGTFDDLADAS